MEQNKATPLGPQQLPVCQVCRLQPAPESVQHLAFIIVEVLMLFYSLKLAAALFFTSYCFAKNMWYCPQCKRQIDIPFQVPGSNENLVLRFGNCMIMLTKNKFRIVAIVVIAVLLYFFATGIKEHSKTHNIEKSWSNLANNCGYEAFGQFSVQLVSGLGEWTIEGIYLREKPLLEHHMIKIYLKMNPTQFKNNVTEDIVVYQTTQTKTDISNRQLGDTLSFTGQWEGRQEDGHLLRFIATNISHLHQKTDLNNLELLTSAQRFIRSHQSQLSKQAPQEPVKN